MALIEFKNLPDTSTPISAGNLNNNFEFLDDKIDGIIESGSNANGSYIKLADGTAICWKYLYTDISYLSASQAGTLMCRGTYNSTPFPITFTQNPTVVVAANAITMKTYNPDPKTHWGTVAVFLPYTAAQTYTTHLYFLAIGKWK